MYLFTIYFDLCNSKIIGYAVTTSFIYQQHKMLEQDGKQDEHLGFYKKWKVKQKKELGYYEQLTNYEETDFFIYKKFSSFI